VLLLAWASALSDKPSIQARLLDVNAAAARLFDEVVVRPGRTDETIGFLMVVGAIAWTTGQFSAYNLVRRGLVAPAIVAIGTFVLVIALAPQVDEAQIYPHLVILTGISLLLVLRANLAHQERSWRRRSVIGGRTVERLYLRGGALVSVVALLGASLLAANVAAAPLREAFTTVDDRLVDLTDALTALFGGAASGTNQGNGSYSDIAPISETWTQEDIPVFTWRSDGGPDPYWRGAMYSTFLGRDWAQPALSGRTADVSAGGDLLAGSADSVSADVEGTRDARFEVTNRGLSGSALLSPATPLSVDRDAQVTLDGDGGPLYGIAFRGRLEPEESYFVNVRSDALGDGGLTQSRLAGAGMQYPTWVMPYLDVRPNTLSDDATAVANRIANLDPDRRSPYDTARRMEDFFTGRGRFADDPYDFTYQTDLRGICLPGEGMIDCLLRTGKGFCEQYATAMAVMLRSQGVPTRYVLGFLPGEPMADGTHLVKKTAAHAWVEAYFPTVGWVRFDPTPGGATLEALGQDRQELPPGDPRPSPEPQDPDQPDPTPRFSDPPTPTPDPAIVTPPDDPSSGDPLGLDLPWPILLLVLLAVVLVVGLVVAYRRLRSVPGRDADLLYRALAGLAARVGHGPRPAQTPYEFTAMLTEAVPDARGDLQAVARGKVEATYARRPPEGDALDALVASFRRAKRALVGLVIRGRRVR
jgi:transglutaminase-like putative cysteine protease